MYRWNYFYTPVQIGEEIVGVRIAVRDLKKQGESQIYNWNIKKDATLDGEGDDMKYRKSHGVSSDASNYNILNADGNVNNLSKEAGSRNGSASFAPNNRDIIATPRISEDNGIRTIGVDKSIDEDAFVDAMWDGAENIPKNNVEKSQLESVENVDGNGIINSGAISGARNPNGEKARVHADKYYGLVRSMKTDVSKISKNSGFSEQQIQNVKNYIFNDRHNLGGEELEMFTPDFMMAESWKRLIEGNVQPHDLTLLLHEIMEMELVENGMSQAEAHLLATKKYNYNKEANDFYGKIKKYKD